MKRLSKSVIHLLNVCVYAEKEMWSFVCLVLSVGVLCIFAVDEALELSGDAICDLLNNVVIHCVCVNKGYCGKRNPIFTFYS